MDKKTCSDGAGRQNAMPAGHFLLPVWIFFACAFFAFASASSQEGQANSRLLSLTMDGYFDPARNFLEATARLRFADPEIERRLWLAEELDLSSVRSGTMTALDFKRDSDSLLVYSQGEEELEFRYSGRLDRPPDPIDSSGNRAGLESANPGDDYCFLSYIKDFYPHPLLDFTTLKMNITVPDDWNCLGSGTLLGVQSALASKTFSFDNLEAKGMALVFGRFQLIGFIAGAIPIRLHGCPDFQYQDYFSESDLAQALSFLSGNFGDLDLPVLNILFRKGNNFGGISYNGLMVLNVDGSGAGPAADAGSKIDGGSLLSMIDFKTDLLVHELAHQWWGGLVSWKTPAENWITEGLATYSTLMYLRSCRGEKAYREILKKLRQRVTRYAKRGVAARGFLLKLLNRDPGVYHALVYLKPALMLAALADKIGEKELTQRLRNILGERRGCNLDSAEFLRLISAGDSGLNAQLSQWIFKPGLPKGLAVQ